MQKEEQITHIKMLLCFCLIIVVCSNNNDRQNQQMPNQLGFGFPHYFSDENILKVQKDRQVKSTKFTENDSKCCHSSQYQNLCSQLITSSYGRCFIVVGQKQQLVQVVIGPSTQEEKLMWEYNGVLIRLVPIRKEIRSILYKIKLKNQLVLMRSRSSAIGVTINLLERLQWCEREQMRLYKILIRLRRLLELPVRHQMSFHQLVAGDLQENPQIHSVWKENKIQFKEITAL